jgi:uncharacterized protein (DUF2141 family)
MQKFILFLALLYSFSEPLFSQNNSTVALEIQNVKINGGKVYVAIYSNEQTFKKTEPDITLEFVADNTIISSILEIPYGEYAITIYQDSNGNGKIDLGLFGIPNEPFGMSNYSGKGVPSNNFNQLKLPVNNTTKKITVGLYRL